MKEFRRARTEEVDLKQVLEFKGKFGQCKRLQNIPEVEGLIPDEDEDRQGGDQDSYRSKNWNSTELWKRIKQERKIQGLKEYKTSVR